MPKNGHSASKTFDVICFPLSDRITSGISYGIVQSSSVTFATCGAAILVLGIGHVNVVYQSVMSMMKRFSCFVGVSSPRISMEIGSYGLIEAGGQFKQLLVLVGRT